MTEKKKTQKKTGKEEALVVIFPSSLWPYRSGLDRMSWTLSEGFARAIGRIEGLLGWVSPRGLENPQALVNPREIPFRVLREEPNSQMIVEETRALHANYALTSRMLCEGKDVEFWFNAWEGETGNLLGTHRVQGQKKDVLWRLVSGFRDVLMTFGVDREAVIGVELKDVVPTGNWEALMAMTRSIEEDVYKGTGQGDVLSEKGSSLEAACRALAFDPGFIEAEERVRALSETLLLAARTREDCHKILGLLIEDSGNEVLREMRRAVNDRWLALAK
jgi:hypothetical protein